jgi:hypothetical protein
MGFGAALRSGQCTVNSGQCFLACCARGIQPSDRLGRLGNLVDSVLVQSWRSEGPRP